MSTAGATLASARAALEAGQLQQAKAMLLDIVRAYPDSGEAWYLLTLTTRDPIERFEYNQHVADLGYAPAQQTPRRPHRAIQLALLAALALATVWGTILLLGLIWPA